jgi:hypothetical protein
MNGGDVRRGALGEHHVLGDLDAHGAQRLDARLGRAGGRRRGAGRRLRGAGAARLAGAGARQEARAAIAPM